MNLQDCLDRLYRTPGGRTPKRGLDHMIQLLPFLDHPEKKCSFIHIAGSNGKGTVACKIASALQVKTGLFTSPHIASFRERMQINRKMIPEQDLCRLLNDLFEIIDSHKLDSSFFEIATSCALLYFAENDVDIAILETGMGGRFDATNVVQPLMSIITSISLEHTEILGKTHEKIAAEKAGIIKPGVPVIIGPTVPLSVIQPITEKLKCPLIIGSDNTSLAQLALQSLSLPFCPGGLGSIPPCRFEVVGNVILDVAHNPESCKRLITQVKSRYPGRKVHCLFSHSKQETLGGVLEELKQGVAAFFMPEISHSRTLSAQTLHEKARQLGCRSQCFPTAASALDAARLENGILLVCGSFYIMKEVRSLLGFKDVCD